MNECMLQANVETNRFEKQGKVAENEYLEVGQYTREHRNMTISHIIS